MKRIVFLILISVFSIFSQDNDILELSDRKIFKMIDGYIDKRDKNITDVIEVLFENRTNYQEFEDYILESAGELVDQDDLDYPLFLVESILTFNLESRGAQKLYVAIVNRKIEIDERRELEEKRGELKKEAITEFTENLDKEVKEQEELTSIVEESSDITYKVYKDFDAYKKKRYINNTYIFPLSNIIYNSEVYDGFMNQSSQDREVKGSGLEMGLGVTLDSVVLRFDLGGNFASNIIFSNQVKNIYSYSNLSLSLPNLELPLFLRTGFYYYSYIFGDDDVNVAITSLPTSTLGIGIYGLKMFKVLKLESSVDFMLAPLYTENLDSGVISKLYLVLNLFRFDTYNVELKGGFDYLWLKEGGLSETNFNPKIGLGISRYE